MNTSERRQRILEYLKGADRPLSATALAQKLAVSRQIIVGDVALLRAAGEGITATPRGYVLERPRTGVVGTVACLHRGEDMERELTLMVDQGCTVENVIVEHPVYGQLTGPLELSSRYDIMEFIRKVEENAARPLSALTDGIHLHTLRCSDRETLDRTVAALEREGFLVR
ncbi:MAG: transcription repressor NadR [Oscillospiraceae bacterium]|nr:transcription repressor NadR [Oscillospiraceae bacterium]MDE7171815.1 transcription repressor NadR [Oscillospiraceae bacterium]